jgi:hypothetical protein
MSIDREKILKAYVDFIKILQETNYEEINKYLFECKPYSITTKKLSSLLNKGCGKQKKTKTKSKTKSKTKTKTKTKTKQKPKKTKTKKQKVKANTKKN